VIAALWSGPVRRRRAFLKDMQGLLSMCDANARSPAGLTQWGFCVAGSERVRAWSARRLRPHCGGSTIPAAVGGSSMEMAGRSGVPGPESVTCLGLRVLLSPGVFVQNAATYVSLSSRWCLLSLIPYRSLLPCSTPGVESELVSLAG